MTVSSPYVVVHYTRTGPDHPRFMKDDNHNGAPNYIEKLAAAANKAWLWYGHNGFKAPLPDTGGPDSKLDIYVKRRRAGSTAMAALVVGGRKGRVIEGVLRDRGHLQYFVPTFRNAKERSNVMLIITSGRQVGTAYKIAYQAL